MFAASKTASVSGGYQISRSLRFNSADSAYLDRAQTTGNTQKATWSGWVKRSALTIGAFSTLFDAGTANTDCLVWNNTGDTLRFFLNGASSADLVTTQQFRDPSAWYHIVIAIDTTQATAANRILMYVNGIQVTAFTTATYPTQNYTFTRLNTSGQSAYLGGIGASSFLSGYMTEVNFIDGQQLTPSSFGETNAQTGVWQPKAYSGSYGTNGFYLNFSDNSNTTAATLGKDYSGNGNNWTPNNFSVTAGSGNDSLVDSPTSYGTDTGVGGTVRGNYATWNALGTNKPNLTNGNLDADGSDLKVAISTIGVSTGKWYWEILIGSGTDTPNMGVTSVANDKADPGVYLGVGRSYVSSGGGGGIYKAYTATSTTANSAFSNANTAGATIGFALDCDAGTLAYYVNNVLGYTDSTIATGTLLFPMTTNFNSNTNAYRNTSVNFGQRPFAYTAPSGYKALCTQNLPTPTIGATTATQAGKYFNPVLYTGTGSSLSVTGVGFQPDWVWVKSRSAATDHGLYDAVRGVQKQLESNNTGAETTETTGITAFNSDGFTTGALAQLNTSSATYVAWNWKANGSGSSNTAGSITSTVSANTTSGFSVVTYSGNSTQPSTVGHGLGVAPSFIIVKPINGGTYDWNSYHVSLGNTQYIALNTTAAASSAVSLWNNTSPTSTVFTVNHVAVNEAGYNFVAYCFAEVAGYSKIGSYTGNGSADGPFVFTGFRPAFILIKNTSSTGYWVIFDVARNTYNAMTSQLWPNGADAESNSYGVIDAISNGFKLRNTTAGYNDSGATYIYMALASNPFKYSLAR